jgi:hypothetical protein
MLIRPHYLNSVLLDDLNVTSKLQVRKHTTRCESGSVLWQSCDTPRYCGWPAARIALDADVARLLAKPSDRSASLWRSSRYFENLASRLRSISDPNRIDGQSSNVSRRRSAFPLLYGYQCRFAALYRNGVWRPTDSSRPNLTWLDLRNLDSEQM